MHALLTPLPSAGCPQIQFHPVKITNALRHSAAHRSLSASGIAWPYNLLAWDQFTESDDAGRIPTERKLARVPAPRAVPREPSSLSQANVTTDHRSQFVGFTDHRNRKKKPRKKPAHRQKGDRRGTATWVVTTGKGRGSYHPRFELSKELELEARCR